MERYIAVAERIVELALTGESTATRDLIFIATPGNGLSEHEAAEIVLRRFLARAFRRPPTKAEVGQAGDQYAFARRSGLDHENFCQAGTAVRSDLAEISSSRRGGNSSDDPFLVSDWELASRLSYFLWASMPDQELFGLAERGMLHDQNVLREQVERMLADEKADTLGTVFAAQWLGFHHVGTRIWLDPIDNPWCTASLMTAMRDESSLFFLSLLRENQPIRRLLDADYTYVNEELATTLYGMSGIEG